MWCVPRILFFDIETAPNLSYVWGHYQQDVIAHEREWYVLCVGYMWLGDKRAKVLALPDYEGYEKDPENDKALAQEVWDLLDEADIVIAHNGDKFDVKKMNARFLAHGLGPPSSYKTVDTLKGARRAFKLNSNRLGDLGAFLGVGEKQKTDGFQTWAGCMRGDEKAWGTMTRYCRQDVELLGRVYLKLLPWLGSHPNLNVYPGEPKDRCPRCGSAKRQRRGYAISRTMRYIRYQCNGCKGYYRERLGENTLVSYVPD